MMKHIWQKWQGVARRIGDIQARLILTLLYFVLIGPFALIVRWGADPLSLKTGGLQGWRLKGDVKDPAMKRAMNQF
jgi:hypothetical protein